MKTGGCLCGAVRYRIDGALGGVYFCHCQQCRKAQGSAFVASVPVAAEAFALVAGEEFLRAYRSSPHKARHFCSVCGSPLFSRTDGAAQVRVRAGTLDEPSGLIAAAHIFVADKASWDDIQDALPRYPAREPGR